MKRTTGYRRPRTIGYDVYKSAPEARALVLFVLKELDDWDHCSILIVMVNELGTQRTERRCTHEMSLRAPNELGPRANDNDG